MHEDKGVLFANIDIKIVLAFSSFPNRMETPQFLFLTFTNTYFYFQPSSPSDNNKRSGLRACYGDWGRAV